MQPTEQLARPNVCAICNTSPRIGETRVVDTEFHGIAPPPSDVVHRKYVCETCGLEIANKLGYVSNEQAKVAFNAAQAATQRLDTVRQQVQSAAEEIVSFAKDVQLGNDRAALEKWLVGDFVPQVKEEVEKVKPVGRPRKTAVTAADSVSDGTTASSDATTSQ